MKGKWTGRVTLRVILTAPRSRRSLLLLRDRHEGDHYEDEYSGTSGAETWSTDEPPRLLKSKEKRTSQEPSPKRPVTCLLEKTRDPPSYIWKTGTSPTGDELQNTCLRVIIVPPLLLTSPVTRAPLRPQGLSPRRKGLPPQLMSCLRDTSPRAMD